MGAGDILTLVEQVAATASRNEKEALLAPALGDALFRRLVRFAYDPFVTFGLTAPDMTGEGVRRIESAEDEVFSLLERLAAREITGNEAIKAVLEALVSLHPDDAEMLRRVIAKDFRAGFTATTLNRLEPNFIPVFEVMLAQPYEQKRVKTFPVYVEPKLDGFRVVCIVEVDDVRFLSRNGKPFSSVEHLAEPIIAMLDAAKRSAQDAPPDFLLEALYAKKLFLDGEIVSGSFKRTSGDLRRKNELAHDARYHLFDVLPLEAFRSEGIDPALTYRIRRAFLEQIVSHAPPDGPIVVTEPVSCSSHAQIMEIYEGYRSAGLEGAVVKLPDEGYVRKRSHAWLKIKASETEDLKVVGAYEGEGRLEGKLGGLIVERDGVAVRVGGGFTDVQRQELWQAYLVGEGKISSLWPSGSLTLIGRIAEVEYHEVTEDGSLRHPRFVRFRPDKERYPD